MVLPQAEPQYDDILVPETKPATEWVNGHLLQKMSPRPRHALVQAAILVALHSWSKAGERGRLLVPDIADKIRVYLQCGVDIAVYVDARRRLFDVYRLGGMERLTDGATFADDALPGLSLDVTEMLGANRAKS